MFATSTAAKRSFPSQQVGLSLVELMISLTIGLVLLLGITMLVVQQSSTRDELEKASRQLENGRYAMQIIHQDIQHAGFYGNYATFLTPPGTLPDPCTTAVADLLPAMALPIQGYDAPTTSPIACLPNANHLAGTDILVVRRASSDATSIAAAAAGAGGLVYLQTTTASQVLSTGAGASTATFPLIYTTSFASGPAELRNYLVRIYFISPCNRMANGSTCTATDDGGMPIPTLKRLELNATGATTTISLVPLVEGIENMQMDYGQDADDDGYPNNYVTAPATTTDWSNVMAISVNLLARNTECTTGHTDIKTYNLGLAGTITPPAPTCPNGDYKRHVFNELVRTINPSGRRAQE